MDKDSLISKEPVDPSQDREVWAAAEAWFNDDGLYAGKLQQLSHKTHPKEDKVGYCRAPHTHISNL